MLGIDSEPVAGQRLAVDNKTLPAVAELTHARHLAGRTHLVGEAVAFKNGHLAWAVSAGPHKAMDFLLGPPFKDDGVDAGPLEDRGRDQSGHARPDHRDLERLAPRTVVGAGA